MPHDIQYCTQIIQFMCEKSNVFDSMREFITAEIFFTLEMN